MSLLVPKTQLFGFVIYIWLDNEISQSAQSLKTYLVPFMAAMSQV